MKNYLKNAICGRLMHRNFFMMKKYIGVLLFLWGSSFVVIFDVFALPIHMGVEVGYQFPARQQEDILAISRKSYKTDLQGFLLGFFTEADISFIYLKASLEGHALFYKQMENQQINHTSKYSFIYLRVPVKIGLSFFSVCRIYAGFFKDFLLKGQDTRLQLPSFNRSFFEDKSGITTGIGFSLFKFHVDGGGAFIRGKKLSISRGLGDTIKEIKKIKFFPFISVGYVIWGA